jgi:ribose-phosphate pyrophosphokinase
MNLDKTLILAFPDQSAPAYGLAASLGLPCAMVGIHAFPDGESRVRLPPALPRRVILYRSLDRPNDKLVELLLAAATARELGAQEVWLIAPYLCYMRQDIAFQPGEAVSQRVIGGLLGRAFDGVVTVDPHLHRVHSLAEAVPCRHALALSAAQPIAAYLRGLTGEGGLTGGDGTRVPLLFGPDEESTQWVAGVAALLGWDHRIAHKRRLGDKQVEIRVPEGPYAGRAVVLLDDMVSTGHTVAETAAALAAHGPASLSLVVTHALFVEGAEARIRAAGVAHIASCDSCPHPSNAIALAPLLAAALAALA